MRCFKGRADGFDAVCFMSLKQKIKSIISIYGVSVDVGAGFYRQLFAEVNTLVKIKRGSNSRVIMHGNTNYGFVRPLSEDRRLGTNQVHWALHESNRSTFTERMIEGARKLRYEYYKCLLLVIQIPDAHIAPVFCSTMDNMSKLVEHKLLHFGNTGTACLGCGRTSILNESVIKKLNSRIENLSLKEMFEERISTEVNDEVDDEDADLTGDAIRNEAVNGKAVPVPIVSVDDRMLGNGKGADYKKNTYQTSD